MQYDKANPTKSLLFFTLSRTMDSVRLAKQNHGLVYFKKPFFQTFQFKFTSGTHVTQQSRKKLLQLLTMTNLPAMTESFPRK